MIDGSKYSLTDLLSMDPNVVGSMDFSKANAGQFGTLPQTNTSPQTNTTNWGMDGYGGVALGGLNAGLAALSYFDNKKLLGKQMTDLDTRIDANRYALAQNKAKNTAISTAFNNPRGLSQTTVI